jgi:hypothetical protein
MEKTSTKSLSDAKSLSEALFEPINKAYQVGGLGLAFLVLGAFIMLIAFFWPNPSVMSYLLFTGGFILVIFTCSLFYVKEIRPLYKVQQNIKHNKELIDTVQKTALEMTELTSDIQALAFKHALEVSSAIQKLRPQLKSIPVIGNLVDSEVMTKTDTMSSAIVDYSGKAKQVIGDIRDALITSNPQKLKKYLVELEHLRGNVENILRKGD